MKLKRHIIKQINLKEEQDDGFIDAPMSERISMMWEITKDAWAFVKGQDAEQRLQRHIATVIRKSG